jgi:hypothetical protein
MLYMFAVATGKAMSRRDEEQHSESSHCIRNVTGQA